MRVTKAPLNTMEPVWIKMLSGVMRNADAPQTTVIGPDLMCVDDPLWLSCGSAAIDDVEKVVTVNVDALRVMVADPGRQVVVVAVAGGVPTVNENKSVGRDKGELTPDLL